MSEDSENYSGMSTLLCVMKNVLLDDTKSTFVDFDALSKSISILADTISRIMTTDYTPLIEQTSKAITALVKFMYMVSIDENTPEDVAVPKDIVEPLHDVASVIPDGKQSEFSDIVAQAERAKGAEQVKSISRKIFVFVFPIVIQFIIASMPNKQLDRIIEQNDRKIEIAEEQMALDRREVEALEDIRDFLQETCNITIDLDDKLDIVDNTTNGAANGIDVIDDLEIPQRQGEDGNGQNENRDLQEYNFIS